MASERQGLSDRALQIVAENKIRAAIDAGEFDNLPDFGRPSAIIDDPYDPNWWIRRKLKLEELVPRVGQFSQLSSPPAAGYNCR